MSEHVKLYVVVGRILKHIENTRKYSSGKAALAHLRNSIGRPLSASVAIWPIIFERMPKHFFK